MTVDDIAEPFAVRLTDPSGSAVSIGNGTDPFRDGYDFVDFPVTIAADGLNAISSVRSIEGESPLSLRLFLRALADDWNGDNGDQRWESIEHDLTIDAKRTLGNVVLTFTLRESYRPNSWSATAVVSVEAGEEMSRLASAVEDLLGSA